MIKSRIKKVYPYVVKLKPGSGKCYSAMVFVQDNFADGTYRWVGSTFFFKNEKDATMFILRWS